MYGGADRRDDRLTDSGDEDEDDDDGQDDATAATIAAAVAVKALAFHSVTAFPPTSAASASAA